MFEAYLEAKALHPKTNKFVGVRSLKAYRGLPRNAGLPFLVGYIGYKNTPREIIPVASYFTSNGIIKWLIAFVTFFQA